MKKIRGIILLWIVGSAVGIPESRAAEAPAPKQQIVNRQTPLNNLTDFFTTLGTSGPRKAHILKERKETRRIERLQDYQRQNLPRGASIRKAQARD